MADTVKVGQWGAPGGQARDINVGSRPQHLKTITISWEWDSRNGRIIGFSFVYIDQHDEPIPVGPWGRIDPECSEIIEMTRDDQLNCVSGTFDDSAGVTSLTLTINRSGTAQMYTYRPDGCPSGPAFSVPLQQGDGEVVAFFGRSNDTLQALGVYVLDKNGLPVMIGPWGGPKNKDITTPVELKSITVYSTQCINGFSFSYLDENGHLINTETWGATTGEKHHFELNQGEYVNNIAGSFEDSGVTSLQFTTNQHEYEPFGRRSGTDFSVPLPDGAVVGNQNGAVLGFFGRSEGDSLGGIGVYVGLAPKP